MEEPDVIVNTDKLHFRDNIPFMEGEHHGENDWKGDKKEQVNQVG